MIQRKSFIVQKVYSFKINPQDLESSDFESISDNVPASNNIRNLEMTPKDQLREAIGKQQIMKQKSPQSTQIIIIVYQNGSYEKTNVQTNSFSVKIQKKKRNHKKIESATQLHPQSRAQPKLFDDNPLPKKQKTNKPTFFQRLCQLFQWNHH